MSRSGSCGGGGGAAQDDGLVTSYFSEEMAHVWPTLENAGVDGTGVIMEFFGRGRVEGEGLICGVWSGRQEGKGGIPHLGSVCFAEARRTWIFPVVEKSRTVHEILDIQLSSPNACWAPIGWSVAIASNHLYPADFFSGDPTPASCNFRSLLEFL